jgi:hypothetical protein
MGPDGPAFTVVLVFIATPRKFPFFGLGQRCWNYQMGPDGPAFILVLAFIGTPRLVAISWV